MAPMRAFRLTRRFALLLAMLLLGGQQAALAHMAAHLGGGAAAAAAAVADQGDDEHGAALVLSHVCTTCAALDGFAAPLPVLPRLEIAETADTVPPAPTFSRPALAAARPYAARAPPALL
jgi:hypothetical protein